VNRNIRASKGAFKIHYFYSALRVAEFITRYNADLASRQQKLESLSADVRRMDPSQYVVSLLQSFSSCFCMWRPVMCDDVKEYACADSAVRRFECTFKPDPERVRMETRKGSPVRKR